MERKILKIEKIESNMSDMFTPLLRPIYNPGQPQATKSGFVPPTKERCAKALGDLSKEVPATRKALENIPDYFERCRFP